jgi:hypothetical protein
MGNVFYVDQKSNSNALGTKENPFHTIQQAADIALAGDRIVVKEGIYRECVNPRNGGTNNNNRITYEVASGEHVCISGSEIISTWKFIGSGVWEAKISNDLFGNYNPFNVELKGDWVVDPLEQPVHLGDVYVNGQSIYEARFEEQLDSPCKWEASPYVTWADQKEDILHPELTLYRWFAKVDSNTTTILIHLQDKNPNEELVEVSVRQSCFYPSQTGINYITVRGFELCNAATPWAPPTADQIGLIGPNWAKGWIIENNNIHDAKCSAISLGKEASTGENWFTKWGIKPGYQYQLESVFLARNIGWSKERIGSHIVRNNQIHDCGQNGIVGNLGCVFSKIYDNEIYNIAVKHEFYGHEIGGIKFHAAIDVEINHNYIHNCSLGIWLDWEAQGTRVSRNILDQNNRDFMIEVTHGPALIDNNIFTSDFSIVNAAQGSAFVNNLICGYMQHYNILNRSTPYHLPHSTEVLGTALVYGYDDRWYQNIFIGNGEGKNEIGSYGTRDYCDAPDSLDSYIQTVHDMGEGDVELFEKVKQPVYIDKNIYLYGAEPSHIEQTNIVSSINPQVSIEKDENILYLCITLPEEAFSLETTAISSQILGITRITQCRFENHDESDISINQDLTGNQRNDSQIAGPLVQLKPGENKIRIW